uniref:Uncharacterized protein n=1 Tax=Arundo donax TaxID=35708 RepID=A0A0A9BIZ0_ARUDO
MKLFFFRRLWILASIYLRIYSLRLPFYPFAEPFKSSGLSGVNMSGGAMFGLGEFSVV